MMGTFTNSAATKADRCGARSAAVVGFTAAGHLSGGALMVVALSSLRVTGDFDATGYTRGTAQKVAADQRMIAADMARNKRL
jgi:hypothetical protein